MSSIVIVTADIGHSAPSSLESFLQGLGHTVTQMSEGTVDATNLDGYDNIICMRNSEGLTTLADHLRGYIARGKWVACGSYAGTVGGSSNTTPAVLVGMPGPEALLSDTSSPLQRVMKQHPVVGNRATHETFEWLSGDEISSNIPYDDTMGQRLSSLPDYPAHSGIHVFSASDLGITPTASGGCGIYIGCIYNRSTYGADADEIMANLLAARPLAVSGTVTDANGDPAQRTVRAYLRSTGTMLAEGESASVDGAFALQTWASGEHVIVALPSATDENALVFDRVVTVVS